MEVSTNFSPRQAERIGQSPPLPALFSIAAIASGLFQDIRLQPSQDESTLPYSESLAVELRTPFSATRLPQSGLISTSLSFKASADDLVDKVLNRVFSRDRESVRAVKA